MVCILYERRTAPEAEVGQVERDVAAVGRERPELPEPVRRTCGERTLADRSWLHGVSATRSNWHCARGSGAQIAGIDRLYCEVKWSAR